MEAPAPPAPSLPLTWESRAYFIKQLTIQGGNFDGSSCIFRAFATRKLIVVVAIKWASLVAQLVKNLPAMQETQVRSLGQEDSLEKEMVTHSSILAWEIPQTEEPGRLQSMGLQRVRHD